MPSFSAWVKQASCEYNGFKNFFLRQLTSLIGPYLEFSPKNQQKMKITYIGLDEAVVALSGEIHLNTFQKDSNQ